MCLRQHTGGSCSLDSCSRSSGHVCTPGRCLPRNVARAYCTARRNSRFQTVNRCCRPSTGYAVKEMLSSSFEPVEIILGTHFTCTTWSNRCGEAHKAALFMLHIIGWNSPTVPACSWYESADAQRQLDVKHYPCHFFLFV